MKTRIFFITFTVANWGLVLYGVLALLKPDILLTPFSEHVYQFPGEATTAITYLSALYRLLGFFNIIPGVLGLIILNRYKTTGQGWLLKVVVASTVLTILGPVVFDNTVGTIGFFEIIEHILFVSVIFTGFTMLRHREVEVI